jgi:RNA polymerase sigma factor (sigma-70 family)
MQESEWLAERFEADRRRLQGMAYRMLGSLTEADDALQESWLRINRAETVGVENLGGWMTTVVSRVCLDMLRSRKTRREDPAGAIPERAVQRDGGIDPQHEAVLADSVGLAMLVVLERLAPAERIAFVLHDMFDVPFEEIARIVNRSPESARQLASRARRRVRGTTELPQVDLARQRAIVDAFLAAARDGDMQALLAALAPDVVFRADAATPLPADQKEMRGAEIVAKQFAGRAELARSALIDGELGIVVAPRGRLMLVLRLKIENGKIAEIESIFDRARLSKMELAALEP